MHRMGMICAMSGDHWAAKQLLSTSRSRLTSDSSGGGVSDSGGAASGLAREADLGLAVAE
jgi:hypothetical protein